MGGCWGFAETRLNPGSRAECRTSTEGPLLRDVVLPAGVDGKGRFRCARRLKGGGREDEACTPAPCCARGARMVHMGSNLRTGSSDSAWFGGARLPRPQTRFELGPDQAAGDPPEATGRSRDSVRLQVARASGEIEDTLFSSIGDFLDPGDLLIVNDSATLPAAIDGTLDDGRRVRVHVSTRVPGTGLRFVELRRPQGASSSEAEAPKSALTVRLAKGASLHVDSPPRFSVERLSRLRRARFSASASLYDYLVDAGRPIRYDYVRTAYPLSYYQTIFASTPGSSEMPSAGRPFTRQLVDRLRSQGVQFANVTLHTGVSSQEAYEPPYPEYFEVGGGAADAINSAHRRGSRVIAVGTTVARAVRSATKSSGVIKALSGFTRHVITPWDPAVALDGIISGWHDPASSHLLLLESFLGAPRLQYCYERAVEGGYRWHEFGDAQLILTKGRR